MFHILTISLVEKYVLLDVQIVINNHWCSFLARQVAKPVFTSALQSGSKVFHVIASFSKPRPIFNGKVVYNTTGGCLIHHGHLSKWNTQLDVTSHKYGPFLDNIYNSPAEQDKQLNSFALVLLRSILCTPWLSNLEQYLWETKSNTISFLLGLQS